MASLDGRKAGFVFGASLSVVVLLSYAIVVSGAPLSMTMEAIDGVHMQAEYIEGSSVEMKPEINSVDACSDTMMVEIGDATVSGVSIYTELPKPLESGKAEVGYELNADEYYIGSLQLVVSELYSEKHEGIGGSLSANSEDGMSFTGEEFRLENVETHVYGFGNSWFDAPFVRTEFEPAEGIVEKYRC